MLSLLFTGYATAQAPESPNATRVASGISLQFVKPTPVHDYTKEVLQPLYVAQAEKQREDEAKAAAIAAAQAQAQAEAARQAQAVQLASVTVSGSCADWIAAAGISDVQNAMRLINWESGCNPNVVNRSSGACGVAQELPCGKSGCVLGDGACQVRWFNQYVINRYGTMANAVAFHISMGWY